MRANPLNRVTALGQSIWLDYIHRDLMASGELDRLIREDDLRGITSNPAIFEQAITDGTAYDADIARLAHEGKDPVAIYETLGMDDVRSAADAFRGVYDRTNGGDGFVSFEVNPHLAHDMEGTVAEGRRLWAALDRPNVFVKVPATVAGVKAIETLIGDGININVTLLFSLDRYADVMSAYMAGLENRLAAGKPIDHVASVASFFLSRIDSLVDGLLEKAAAESPEQQELAARLKGQTAVASARMAYRLHHEMFRSPRFAALAEQGAQVQRPLWASTSVKNPAFSDVKYVEALIGPNTVTTLPVETLDAYRDHGKPAIRVDEDPKGSERILAMLEEAGIDLDAVTRQLEEEGIEKFNKPFDSLMAALEKAARAA